MIPNRTAFTLIEILLVVVVLSVIVAIAAPNFEKTFEHLQLSKTANDMVYLVRWAQSRAVNEQRTYQLSFGSDLKTYRVLAEKPSSIGDTKEFVPVAVQMGRTFSVPRDVKLTFETRVLNIYSDGTLDKVRITLKAKDRGLILSSMEMRGSLFILDQDNES